MFTKKSLEYVDLIGVLIALTHVNPNLVISDMLEDFSDNCTVSFGDAEFTIITGFKCAKILRGIIPEKHFTGYVAMTLQALEKESWVNLES